MIRPWFDRLGTVASAACALHCAALSLAPAVLPVVGLSFLHDERFEWAFVASAVAFAGLAAWQGQQAHGNLRVLVGFGVGASALVGARLAEVCGIEGGMWLALFGGATLVAAHLVNLRCCDACAVEAIA